MAEENLNDIQIFNENDPLDINELAALNNDISPEFIEQLQNKIAQNVNELNASMQLNEDETLFEETNKQEIKPTIQASPQEDSFMKKYKAKQMEKNLQSEQNEGDIENNTEITETNKIPEEKHNETLNATENISNEENKEQLVVSNSNNDIENLSGGNIKEKLATADQIAYSDSLDLVDNNINYSKYVIYINPENKNFIDSLTVKERKNLINRILREQNDVAITKRKWGVIQTVIRHSIVAIITIAIAIPVIYITINASLETSIDNYRRSQSNFQTLYKEHGKIKAPKK